MKSVVKRKWSFVRPSRPAVWRWLEAFALVVLSHGLLCLLIGVKPEGVRTVSHASSGATLLSGHALPAPERARMQRWLDLHDPAAAAEPGHPAGLSGILPNVLHHDVAAENPAVSAWKMPPSRNPSPLPVKPLEPMRPLPPEIVDSPVPFQAQILDPHGGEVKIALAIDGSTAGVSGPTILRIVRQGGNALAVLESSCGVPALDALAQGGILRSLPEAADGDRFTVNWPRESKAGGEK